MRTGRQSAGVFRFFDNQVFARLDHWFGGADGTTLQWLLNTQDAIYERKKIQEANGKKLAQAIVERDAIETFERQRELATRDFAEWARSKAQALISEKHTCETAKNQITDLRNVTMPALHRLDTSCLRSLFEPPKLQFREEILQRDETICVMHCQRMTDLMNAKWHLNSQGGY